jgi:hypothetical protein
MLASNRVRCLAYGIAIVVFGSLSTAHAEAVALATPAGLAPGAQFRFLFLTSGTQAATSTDIADYNTFVNSQASGATYEGSVVSWKAVGSTATVNARDNVGGFGGNVPVYLTNGTLLAGDLTTGTSNKGLWSGLLFTTPTIGIDGNGVTTSFAHTGSNADGTGLTDRQLGADSFVQYGDPTINAGTFGRYFSLNGMPTSIAVNFYGVSSELTVPNAVPEIDPAGMGSVLALVTSALGLLERKRSRARG